jgi:Sec7-like guanine-nucleotide exchange factor
MHQCHHQLTTSLRPPPRPQVGASCHTDSSLAMYAVDSLRQLVAKLLARAELAHFTHQEDALRPFVAVLRQCDDVTVRELTVACVQQAVTTHPKGLGSGWRMVLQALRLGAVDRSPAVMTTSLEALQVGWCGAAVCKSRYCSWKDHAACHRPSECHLAAS